MTYLFLVSNNAKVFNFLYILGGINMKRLTKSNTNKTISGVCGGIGEYFGIDPTLVRIIFAILSVFPGSLIGGAIAYVVLAVIMPDATASGDHND